MKKLLLALSLFFFATASAQEKDVTTFLGIPVDGYKSEMIQKLKEKGFVSSAYREDVLEGEFNGTEVQIHIVTNNNKVYRIMLCDKNTIGATDIRIRFNNLCDQFANNSRYMSANEGDGKISEDEDIGYNIKVKDKRYEASFRQIPLQKTLADMVIGSGYTKEELNKEEVQKLLFQEYLKIADNKSVWFMISEFKGEYCITMYYDNRLNQANGEDL